MNSSLIQDALKLKSPEDYFSGRTAQDICIPKNLIVFSRKSASELQRRSFDSYPHHRYVLVFNLMTEGTINLDGIHWRLSPGCALTIFPYQFHQFIDLADPKLLWLIITFELELPTNMQSFRNTILNIDDYGYDLLKKMVGNYRQEAKEQTNRRLTLDCAVLINYLREQANQRNSLKNMKTGNIKGTSNALIRSVQNCLTDNTGTMQNASDIAGDLNMSESNLRAVFRQQFNISLGSYIKNFRAHQAIQLMQNANLSLTDIAFELGFTSLSSFSRFFSTIIGESPRKYRSDLLKRN